MGKFDWNEKLSVGDAQIDADHQGLFALIEELERSDLTDGLLVEIIGRLEDYAAGHFAREEALMRRVGFPGYDGHVREHRAFSEWIESVKTTYRRAAESPFQVGDLVNGFLGNWLTRHIMKEDMKFRDFVADQRSRRTATDS